MSVKTGWLKDHNGDKFAPKTYASQVVDINGTPIEDKVNENIENIKSIRNDLNEHIENSEVKIEEALSNAKAIIDVTELPETDIKENAIYRLATGMLIFNGFYQNDICTCHMVEELPSEGEMCYDGTNIVIYFNISDNTAYGYVNDILSSQMSVPSGWYTVDVLMGALGYVYGGVIYDINDAINDNTFYLHIEYILYYYKYEWNNLKIIGKMGTGKNAEVFNDHNNIASGNSSHAEGYKTTASRNNSHAEGYKTTASGDSSHAEGSETKASGDDSHAEGCYTIASGIRSHAEGSDTTASGSSSHAEGFDTTASGHSSHAEGQNTIAFGDNSHTEGYGTTVFGYHSHAEGYKTTASGFTSHAEGKNTTASGDYSHVQGKYNKVYCKEVITNNTNIYLDNNNEYCIGNSYTFNPDSGLYNLDNYIYTKLDNTIVGKYIGLHYNSPILYKFDTVTSIDYTIIEGTGTKYTAEEIKTYAHMVGNGIADDNRSNAHTLDWDGNAWYASDVYVGGTSQDDTNAKKLATEEYVDEKLSEITIEQLDAWYDEIEV